MRIPITQAVTENCEDIAELKRCKLPKTCYLTCELNAGPRFGSYRRTQVFGGGENIQSQGMGRFTGSHPLYSSQPWLGNARGGIVASTGAGHFFDRSGGRNARESMAHEAYIYVPAAHVVAVNQIRFLSLGEQFSQVRVSPAGGNLNAAAVVGSVNYLGPPNTRQIGGVVTVAQDEIYGVLNYALDRQDNADTRIQYRSTGGPWVNLPIAWIYPNIEDAQAASSVETRWCVQGGIATNEDDDRRITEADVMSLGVSSEIVDCDDVALAAAVSENTECIEELKENNEPLTSEAIEALIGPHAQPATTVPIADNEADAAIRTGQVGTSALYARADHNHPIRRQANPGDPVITVSGSFELQANLILDRWSDEESYSYAFRTLVNQPAGNGWGWINVPNIAGFQRPRITGIGSYRFASTAVQDDDGSFGASPRGPFMAKEAHHWSSTQRIYGAYFRRDNDFRAYIEYVVEYTRT